MKRGIFIIAEAGVNHNGSLLLAKKMVDAAAKAGADAVKFQAFKTEELVSAGAPKADYQKKRTVVKESQYQMIKKLELGRREHQILSCYCVKRKIVFLSSPFDLHSITMLDNMGLKIFKIPSGELTNLPYLRKIGALKKRVILSSGMAYLPEVKKAVEILINAGTKRESIVVLHCTTEYPAPVEEVNLKAMLTIGNKLRVMIGYSDHTQGIEIAVAAAAIGARVIEKHFTLSRKLKGPDHAASLEPRELAAMVRAIRNVEAALGDGIKRPSPSEKKNVSIARKSIVAALPIFKGERFSERNITVKRPGTGLSPMSWDRVIGQRACANFRKDDFIKV
jgi:N,N'-diacetyllegionaminate synthase